MLHHHLIKTSLDSLRPTQMTIGYLEVEKKRTEWESLGRKKSHELVKSHWFPSVLGPNNQYFITDHHHLGMALHQEGQKTVYLTVLKDFSWLSWDSFWKIMEFHQWVHPYNQLGQRVEFDKLPHKIAALKDDPYRSLAGLVRDAGGFAKDLTPFNEFLWADFFRDRIAKKLIKQSMKESVLAGKLMARDQEASYLPGWIGE